MLRRWLFGLALVSFALGGCGSGDDTAAPTTTTSAAPVTTSAPTTLVATTAPPTTASRPAATSTTTARPTAAKAVIEPHQVAGIPMGATKSEAIAVLGPPTNTGREADLSGKKYDYLRWEFSGNRGLFLNFRTDSVTSPLLTDWIASAPGPTTKAGTQVGDTAAKVVAAYGPLTGFCCESQIASVTQGAGRMIVIVPNDSKTVSRIVGGDPGSWSRSIAD
jgi:hypothetical protein